MSTSPMEASTVGQGPACKRYGSLRVEREPFLIRARRLSRLTIPTLYREYGENGTTNETIPWQSLGAYGVNNLAAKMIMAMYPPGISFINLKADKRALADLAQLPPDIQGKLKAEIDKGLSGVEVQFIEGVEEDGDRWRLFDAARHLIVGGSHCLQIQDDATLKSIPLENFVCVRDNAGNLVEAVIEDELSWETAPDDVQEMALKGGYKVEYEEGGNRQPKATQKPLRIYSHVLRRKANQYDVYQECWGEVVPRTDRTFDQDALPYIFLRMVGLKKEHYGRSYVEDYEGDLQTLDGLWQVLTEGSAAIAQLKWLVKPGGVTSKKLFAEAANGAVLTGDAEDVTAVRAEKGGDLAVADSRADKLEQRLSKVFLLYSSIQRSGERVTAEEIRTIRQDLEAAMGGVYSNQVTTWQAPYARLKMQALQRASRVPKLPKGTTKMTILTGDAGLGRLQKAQSLDEFLQVAAQVLGEAAIAPYINVSNYLTRSAANRSVDQDGLIKSEEEVQAAQQQAQQMAMMSQVAPEAVRQGGQMIQNAQEASIAQGSNQQEAAPQAAQ